MNEDLRVALVAYLDALQITPETDSNELWCSINRLKGSDLAAPVGDIKIAEGASKICLVFKNFPFVIKWSEGDKGRDESMREVSIYGDAVAAGIEFLFPKTEFFCKLDKVSFVLQEKVDCSAWDARHDNKCTKVIHRVTKTPTDYIYNKMRGHIPDRTLNEDWAKMVISLYGKRVAKRWCEFITNHRINDLHQENIGYKNFRPVVLDFSGYHR